ncbi:ATP-binding region ATPase domain protein (plasmid) [Gemmatirosa kalamazoonensis]|uniref:ATP-binding region ATPase domain protein n=1 Tax=Gemmatirosa kalamazoonensis TaxID=861299 RepID=W0RSF8_9BACT|nr:ATP-binding protein [Gemmatirosa kalamazoonensis]AHG93225.1 ATP-binding region ATPase domain protein [Gemmatirosa kalamazoonensis]
MPTSADAHASALVRWRTLGELTQAIAGYRTLEGLFHDLNGRLHDLLNFTYLSVVLHDPAADRMRVWQIEGAPMPMRGHVAGIPMVESPSGRVWTTQQPVVIHDTATSGVYASVEKALYDAGVRAFLSLPLTTVHRRLGAFNLGNSRPGVYDDIDLELPLLVASHIAVAVDNALHAEDALALHAALEERNRELTRERERLEEIVREIPAVVWELYGDPASPACRVAFLNAAADELLGRTAGRPLTTPRRLAASIHKADRENVARYLDACMRRETVDGPVLRCLRRKTEKRWVELRATPILDDERAVVGLRGVAVDVTTHVQMTQERRRHEEMLAAERLRERARVAADIHDTLIQSAVGSSLRLQALSLRLSAADVRLRGELDEALGLLDDAIVEGRKAVQGLRASAAELDTVTVLHRAAERLAAEHRTAFRITANEPPSPVDGHVLLEIQRAALEAVTNAFRHAEACLVSVDIEYRGESVRVTISDDGVGIDPRILGEGRLGHFGLLVMRERVEAVGGTLRVTSQRGGTQVEIVTPVRLPESHRPSLTRGE